MTFSPFFFFFCFTSLFFWVFSLFPSLSPSQPIRLGSPFAMILMSNPFATSQHQTHSQRSLLPNPFATIPIRDESFTLAAKSFAVLVTFACSSSLLLTAVTFACCRRICSLSSLSSHLLAIVAEACSSSLKLDRRCRSNPSDILAPSHTDTLASFRRFSSHGPSTSTHTDCSTSLRRFKP